MNNIRDTSNTSQPRDNSKTARRYLDMTGIQSVLNIEHVTEISVNKPEQYGLKGKMAGNLKMRQTRLLII